MKKVHVVFGTRPEAIKMAPLVNELRTRQNISTIVSVTGQHRQMLDQVLSCFEIVPDYDLSIMKQNQTLYSITTDTLLQIKEIFEKDRPSIVLVHGDTTTAFAAALAAFYMQIPVGHIEAGLRTNNIYSPYPEEFNRQAVGIIAKYHFAPTENARRNLLAEGKEPRTIYVTGNTAIDAMKTTIQEGYSHPVLDWAADSRMIILTAHRRENLGDPLRNIFAAIRRIVEKYRDIKVIYPVHLNPAVKKCADELLGGHARIKLIEPLDVIDFHNFMARAHLILTDSGGIQEEAPSLGKPVLVMRDTTERPEGLKTGTLKLVGTSEDTVFHEFELLLNDPDEYQKMSKASNPYGDGFACQRIADILCGKLRIKNVNGPLPMAAERLSTGWSGADSNMVIREFS